MITIMNTIPFSIRNGARTLFTVCCIRNRTSLFLTEKVPLNKTHKGTEKDFPYQKAHYEIPFDH